MKHISIYREVEPELEKIRNWFIRNFDINLSNSNIIRFSLHTVINVDYGVYMNSKRRHSRRIFQDSDLMAVFISDELDKKINDFMQEYKTRIYKDKTAFVSAIILFRALALPEKLVIKKNYQYRPIRMGNKEYRPQFIIK